MADKLWCSWRLLQQYLILKSLFGLNFSREIIEIFFCAKIFIYMVRVFALSSDSGRERIEFLLKLKLQPVNCCCCFSWFSSDLSWTTINYVDVNMPWGHYCCWLFSNKSSAENFFPSTKPEIRNILLERDKQFCKFIGINMMFQWPHLGSNNNGSSR